jgi:hypothetical protein
MQTVTRAVATIALIGLVVLIAGMVKHDDAMFDAGLSTFILGSMVASAMGMLRRQRQRKAEAEEVAAAERVSLTVALTESVVQSMRAKK